MKAFLRLWERHVAAPANQEAFTLRTFTPPAGTRFYAGVDLHARSMFTHVLDHAGRTVFEKDLLASPDTFLDAVQPFRPGLVVGCECMFAWYWLADLCEDHSIPFVLGHALYMKMIHGGKAKNDKIDAAKHMRGQVEIVGLSGGRIPWPVGKRGSAKAIVLFPFSLLSSEGRLRLAA
jgi:hypothetical protein